MCVLSGRPYAAPPDGQAHENPEWEKARQALASITKSQAAKKAPQAKRTPAVVSVTICIYDYVIIWNNYFLLKCFRAWCGVMKQSAPRYRVVPNNAPSSSKTSVNNGLAGLIASFKTTLSFHELTTRQQKMP